METILLLLFMSKLVQHQMSGIATHYGCGWNGRVGASGIVVNCHDPTAAHKTLPFGTIVRVTNNNPKHPKYGQSTVVIIFDRGPQAKSRCIDMMPYSLWSITQHKAGGVRVKLEIVSSKYACKSNGCLARELHTKRIDDKKMLELLTGI